MIKGLIGLMAGKSGTSIFGSFRKIAYLSCVPPSLKATADKGEKTISLFIYWRPNLNLNV